MTPIKILLVEDSPTQAAFSKHELQTIGPQVTVEVAHTATEARQKISLYGPKIDLAVLDLVLPDGNGLEMCREIKNSVNTQHLHVVIFSMEGLSKHRQEAYEVGADHYISKGGTGDMALRLVAMTLLRNKLRKPPRIGEALVERGYLSVEQLQAALSSQKPSHLLGQWLIEKGYISQSQLDEVLAAQKRGDL